MKKTTYKKWMLLTMTVLLFSNTICTRAGETESRKLSILQVDGREAQIRKNDIKMTASKGMKLAEGNQLTTGTASYIYIEADNDKTFKLNDNTSVEIEQASSKSLKLTLTNGTLFFNIENPLKEEEEMKFKAAQTSMSIRGTSGIFIYHWTALTFYLIEGTVEWDLGNGQTLTIHAGEKVELVRKSGEEAPGSTTEAEYVLKQISSFHWSELSMEHLKTILENKEHLDLSAIGLDSAKEQEKANAVLFEYETLKKAQEEERKAKAAALKERHRERRNREHDFIYREPDANEKEADKEETDTEVTPPENDLPDSPSTPPSEDGIIGEDENSRPEKEDDTEVSEEEILPEEEIPEEIPPENDSADSI